MKPVRFLTATHLQHLHYIHITPLAVRLSTVNTDDDQPNKIGNLVYLESAAASPINHHLYENVTDHFQLAALLAEKVTLNHAFQDGNKRTALYAADMFLQMNGGSGLLAGDDRKNSHGISPRGLALADAMVDVATKRSCVEDLASLYREVAVTKDV